jgi:H+/Cl- antiporter ClcA
MAGISAGFGSVFGTPIAGAVFALEVLKSEKLEWGAMLPCLTAAVVADWTCAGWGIHHTHYQMTLAGFHLEPWLLGKVILAAVIFGWVGAAFTRSYRWLRNQFAQRILRPELRPVAGGVIVIGLFFLAGGDYLGLGVLGNGADAVTLPAMFHSSEIPASAWIWKFIFTVVTLSAGFKGGEVTPLFFIGAALGNAFAQVLGAPLDLFAAIGFVALFAAASKTPIASTLLGMELFGIGNGFYLAAACLVAYRFSGQSGIYTAHGLAATRSSQISH